MSLFNELKKAVQIENQERNINEGLKNFLKKDAEIAQSSVCEPVNTERITRIDQHIHRGKKIMKINLII